MSLPDHGVVLLNSFYDHLKAEARAQGKAHQVTQWMFERRYGLKPYALRNYRSNSQDKHRFWRQRQSAEALPLAA